MSNVGLTGQFSCFALGAWIGSVFAGAAETVLRPRAATSRDLPFEILIAVYVPLCLILAALFVVWIAFRSRSDEARVVHWSAPFVLGLFFFPLIFTSIALLIRATGQGQGSLVGSLIALLFAGVLIASAEATYRLQKRQVSNNES